MSRLIWAGGANEGTDAFGGRREKIEEEHQKLRESLRGHARKRHREAAKRGRKKTASRRVGGVLEVYE